MFFIWCRAGALSLGLEGGQKVIVDVHPNRPLVIGEDTYVHETNLNNRSLMLHVVRHLAHAGLVRIQILQEAIGASGLPLPGWSAVWVLKEDLARFRELYELFKQPINQLPELAYLSFMGELGVPPRRRRNRRRRK